MTLRKLARLSGQQRRVLVYACLLLNGIRLGLWLLPFRSVRNLLDHLSDRWQGSPTSPVVSVSFIVRSLQIGTRYTPGRAKCLARALTTQVLLNRYGYAYQMHIGVAKDAANRLTAHAWIEYEGQVIVGALDTLSRFQPLVTAGTADIRARS